MNTLHLQQYKGWFDMVRSGKKKEEYRDITDYWVRRLFRPIRPHDKLDINPILDDLLTFDDDSTFEDWDRFLRHHMIEFKHYDQIQFKNGFARNGKPAPQFTAQCLGIRIGKGRLEWGASGLNQFIIEIGGIYENH
jgi:hypothetical protein